MTIPLILPASLPAPDHATSGTRTPSAAWLAQLAQGPGFMRMALALLVFVSHVSRFEVGRPAVVIFFMLSGYWVVRLYEQARGAQAGQPARAILAFWIDRILRIWPLFAVMALVTMVVVARFDLPARGTLVSTLPLLGLASRTNDLLGVSWSLDLEMQFYLSLPFIALAAWRLGLRTRMIDTALLIGIATLAGAWLLSRGVQTFITFAPAFAIGGMIHVYHWRASRATALLAIGAFLACAALFIMVPDLNTLLLKYDSSWWRDLVHLGWCLLLAPLIAYNVHQRSGPLDRHLGNLSYPFYLVHPLMISLAFALIGKGHGRGVLLALALSVLLALLLYGLIDRPIERLRRRVIRHGIGDLKASGGQA